MSVTLPEAISSFCHLFFRLSIQMFGKFIIRELKQFAIAIDNKNIIMFPFLKIKVNVIWSYIML